ncbi:MAG: AIR synthase-related protein, partial [Candidatus Omnitrophota bacterium]|nr:AIR synthase-related protein [Candidatus Omnitrophota bacterium]
LEYRIEISFDDAAFGAEKTISIPPTLLISCIGIMDDVSKAITMDLKEPASAIYLVGNTYNELGGSQYYKMLGFTGNDAPRVDPVYGRHLMTILAGTIRKGYVRSCHDCSDGGMAVSLAEMSFAGGFGMDISLIAINQPGNADCMRDHILLFSESNTRFIVEVTDEKKFEAAMKGVPVWKLGHARGDNIFRIYGLEGKTIIETDTARLKSAWQRPFKDL